MDCCSSYFNGLHPHSLVSLAAVSFASRVGSCDIWEKHFWPTEQFVASLDSLLRTLISIYIVPYLDLRIGFLSDDGSFMETSAPKADTPSINYFILPIFPLV